MIRHIFYSSEAEFIVYRARGKILFPSQHFEADEAGQQQFIDYLRQYLKTPIVWLVDTTKEEYHVNFLPHVFGRDRRNLLALKKQRLFEHLPYSYATIQRRETEGRRDDRVLLMALRDTAVLQPWLDIVLDHRVPLINICSLPLLTEYLLKYCPKSPATLLVSHTPKISAYSAQGLRQSFFLNQKLQLTRLVPLDIEDTMGYADHIIDQVVRTQRYLESVNSLPANVPLSVVIFTQPQLADLLNKRLDTYPSGDDLQFHLLDSRELATQMGLRTEDLPLYLYHLVTPNLMRWWPPNHYARLLEKRYFLYHQLRFAIHTLSGLILTGGLIAGGIQLGATVDLRQKTQTLTQEKLKLETALKDLQLPDLPADVLLIRNVVDVGRYLETQHISPEKMWVEVSRVLKQHPDLKLHHLEWGITQKPAEIFQSALFAKYLSDGGKRVSSGQSTIALETDKGDFLEGIRLYGEVESFHSDYQIALEKYNKFVRELEDLGQNAWAVNPLISPSTAGSQEVIKGTLQQQKIIEEKAPFAVEVLLKHRYASESLKK